MRISARNLIGKRYVAPPIRQFHRSLSKEDGQGPSRRSRGVFNVEHRQLLPSNEQTPSLTCKSAPDLIRSRSKGKFVKSAVKIAFPVDHLGSLPVHDHRRPGET